MQDTLNANLNVGWEETMACQETMEERLEFKEPNGI
jgi:hypothetical protein